MSKAKNPSPIYADIGVNFQGRFDYTTDEIIAYAKKNLVRAMISITNDTRDIEKNVTLAKKYPGTIMCTIGVHPHNAKFLTDKKFAEMTYIIERNVGNGKKIVCAIGECGLDYNRMNSSKSLQLKWFRAQINLATKLHLPLYMHCRDAFNDFTGVMEDSGFNGKKIVHCFTGDSKELFYFLDNGYHIGITGWITQQNKNKDGIAKNHRLIEAITMLKDDCDRLKKFMSRVMIETDSPWLVPHNLEGPRQKTNYPENVHYVCKALSGMLGMTHEALARITYKNSLSFFRSTNV